MASPASDSKVSPFDAISPRPLHGEVVQRLRTMIIRGEIAPGERLNERALAERFNISRTPLRDAIKLLATESLVELTPNRGAVVSRITVQAAEELFQVLSALEQLAGELAAVRATDEEIATIAALHEQMRRHYEGKELEPYFALNQRIHESILACARNSELSSVHERLSWRIRRIRLIANLSQPRWDQAMREHDAILTALRQRDGARLGAVLKDHLKEKFASIRDLLSED